MDVHAGAMKKPHSIAAIAAFALLFSACSTLPQHEADDSDTINPVPAAGSSFQSALGTFTRQEDAGREFEHGFVNYVYSGCLGTPVAGLIMTPTACTAYNKGVRAGATLGAGGGFSSAITFPNNSTTWVALNQDRSGNTGLPTFTRVAGSHYLIDSTSGAQPTMPADAQILMKVVTAGGAIMAVTDLRNLRPIASGQLPTQLSINQVCNVVDIGGPLFCNGDSTHDDSSALLTCSSGTYKQMVLPGGRTCNFGTAASPRSDTLNLPADFEVSGSGQRVAILSLHTTGGGGACSAGSGGGLSIEHEAISIKNVLIQNDDPATCVVNWSQSVASVDVLEGVRIKFNGTAAANNPTCLYMDGVTSPFTRDLDIFGDTCGLGWDVRGSTNHGLFIHTTMRPNSSSGDSVVFNRGKPQIWIGQAGTPQGNRWIATNCEIGPNCIEMDAGVGNTFEEGWDGDVTPSNVTGIWTPGEAIVQNNWLLQSNDTTVGTCHAGTAVLDGLSGTIYQNETIYVPCGAANAIVKRTVISATSATSVTLDSNSTVNNAGIKVYQANYTAPMTCWRSQTNGTTGAVQPVWPAAPTAGTTLVTDNGNTYVASGPCAWIYLNSANVASTTIIGGYHLLLVAGVVNNGALNTKIIGGQWVQGQYAFVGLGGGSFALDSVRISSVLAGVVVRGTGDQYDIRHLSYAGITNIFDFGDTADGDVIAATLTDVSGPDTSHWHIASRNNSAANTRDTFSGGVAIGNGTPMAKVKQYTPTLSPALVAANTCAAQPLTVTGVTTADHIVECKKPTEQAGLGLANCRVSGADTVSMNFCNTTGAGITPTATEVYSITAVTF